MMKITINEEKWRALEADAKDEGVYVSDILFALYLRGYVFDIDVDTDEISNELSYLDEKVKEYHNDSKSAQEKKNKIQEKYRFRHLREKRNKDIKVGIRRDNDGFQIIKKDKTGKLHKEKVESLDKNFYAGKATA